MIKELWHRYKWWRVMRQAAEAWREATGGSCRYKFDLAGSIMAFSGPECESSEEMALMLESLAAALRAPMIPMDLRGL